ncbi:MULTISPECIES: glycoside hydrolase family 2 protein [Halocynthiibacter]|uniref:Glycoside hydrolase family 2 protein n=1 Tax=Halocynthiibacter halioticoli TaxID=2986804 RepID=A0AAE3J1P8_9RHOB|nr:MULTISPECIES: glycoside hydrolase family 2 TIM barrel-domain containing protein [Halocynthiibacter]MCV6825125.1 glycoside hydrolase family 2 protein [Halocynthiibacter halioticoli]MCW4058126.1 glycoside hydrolase family 2 protein [Halocynthiibacter sp. SDUM655004]
MSYTEFCNEGWLFAPLEGEGSNATEVSLPHSSVELPYDYFDEKSYQKAFSYRKRIDWSEAFAGKQVSLVFDGVMADAKVFVNGQASVAYTDGYTPFEVDLTEALGSEGVEVEVQLSGAENPEIPPFGGQIDYLTYAGIYRDVWIKVSDPIAFGKVRVETFDVLSEQSKVRAEFEVLASVGIPEGAAVSAEVLDFDGNSVARTELALTEGVQSVEFSGLSNISLWSPQNPALYTLQLSFETEAGSDTRETTFGFRDAKFTPKGFFLNGERVKLIGLNRHQSFPYTGYAQGRASQERDAEILKNELGCNIVRTSHYPQSPWFLDHCDRIGLMVLEEIPGWQHIGGEEWKNRSVENVRAMIERDWNHPSIIMWGVRINESPDDSDFYQRTNALTRELDPTRPTGGIRKDLESEFLEDVYTFNDFILGEFELPGANRERTSLRSQQEVTGLGKDVPYLVTEYNGHMYPTKVYDQEQRQIEHVTRHLDVLDAAFADDSIAGCIGWCMFDYNTHSDFGSGDRVCHHGVMSMFREPKFAAYAYASQVSPQERVVMQPVTIWARGERNIGGVFPLMVLTNCDEVRVKFPSGIEVPMIPYRERYAHLPHPPMKLEPGDLPNPELGRWGSAWLDVEIVGYLDGKPVERKTMLAAPVATTLEVAPDQSELVASHGEVRVAIRALDQVGNLLKFISEPVTISVEGAATRVGPEVTTLRGGTSAFWVRPTGEVGEVNVTVKSPRFGTVKVALTVRD